MDIGKLYKLVNAEFIVEVNYQLHDSSADSWWGELVPTEYRRLTDGDGYMIELQDGRKGRCSLRKKVNKAVIGVPPRYFYQFSGSGPFK